MARVKAKIHAVALPRALVKTAIAGEWVGNLGGSDTAIKTAQQAVADKAVRRISVYGIDEYGNAIVDSHLDFDHSKSGEVYVNSEEGMSMIEAFDTALAGVVTYTRDQLEEQGLKTVVQFTLTDEVNAEPERRDAALKKLNLVDAAPLQRAAGTSEIVAVDYRAGGDKGFATRLCFWRRK